MNDQFIKAEMVDKAICEWSMQTGTALTEQQINSLVDFVTASLNAQLLQEPKQ